MIINRHSFVVWTMMIVFGAMSILPNIGEMYARVNKTLNVNHIQNLNVEKKGEVPLRGFKTEIEYLVIRRNKNFELVKVNTTLHVVKGDVLEVVDVVGDIPDKEKLIINFVGFQGGNKKSSEEDRNRPFRTDKDILSRFALNKDKDLYEIYVKEGTEKIAYFYVKIINPQFSYLLLQRNEGSKMVLFNNEALNLKRSDNIKIIDMKTNVQDNKGVKLRVKLLAGDIGKGPLFYLKKDGNNE